MKRQDIRRLDWTSCSTIHFTRKNFKMFIKDKRTNKIHVGMYKSPSNLYSERSILIFFLDHNIKNDADLRSGPDIKMIKDEAFNRYEYLEEEDLVC